MALSLKNRLRLCIQGNYQQKTVICPLHMLFLFVSVGLKLVLVGLLFALVGLLFDLV